jgi:hypothetical protein
MFLYSIQSSAKSRVLDETDAGRSLMNIKNRRVSILILVVLHWLLVVDLTFHHPVKPVELCLTGRILPISRCYLLFHNSQFSSVIYYGALYRMPWWNPIWWGQFGYPYEDFLPAHVRVILLYKESNLLMISALNCLYLVFTSGSLTHFYQLGALLLRKRVKCHSPIQ